MPGQCRPLIGQYLIIPGCDWLLVVTCDDVMLSLHNRNVGGGKQTLSRPRMGHSDQVMLGLGRA